MATRVIFLAAAMLLSFQVPAIADQESVTPDQIIARYLQAIGAEQFPSITTFVERGEIQEIITDPNIANLGRLSSPPPMQRHERYETYFKSPNLRFSSVISEDNQLWEMHGCDGKVAWYIDPFLKRREFKPKPGREYSCETGFKSSSPLELNEHAKMRLAGKKTVQGRSVWEIKIENAKPEWPDTYYFDAETYVLLRYQRRDRSSTLLDYREVGGIKRPFTVIREDSHERATITVREIQINLPIDDARFVEPQQKNGGIPVNPVLPPTTAETTATVASPSKAPGQEASGAAVQINYPNFTTCTIAELQSWVPELRQLEPASDQNDLQHLLQKVGEQLRDTARNTPNLISREAVTSSARGTSASHREYDYLIVPRLSGAEIILNEFRVDVRTGEKFQADDSGPLPEEATAGETTHAGGQRASSEPGGQPLSQGFASSWVDFYPRNQMQSTFRYVGEEKSAGRRSLVIAFAQKPQAVTWPGLFRYQDRSVPMYFQGVAWFDPSDFRILRLHTELLAPLPEVSLQKLSSDIQFADTRIPGVTTTLFLPREVTVASVVAGSTLLEHHAYSTYRLFRAQSKIVLQP
jgi:hypothetical protein